MTIHLCKLQYGHKGDCTSLCGKKHVNCTKSPELCNCEACIARQDAKAFKYAKQSGAATFTTPSGG